MRARSSRRPVGRGRFGAALLATAVASMTLVSLTSTTTSAAPVNATINTSCGARDNDPETVAALNQAALLLGSNRIAVRLVVTADDIPATAGLEEEIDARFSVRATLDQALIDGAAGLIPSIPVTNIGGTLLVNGPSSVPSFPVSAPNTTVTPVAGQPANLNLGPVGGPITTTGGGIITYRVGSVRFDSALSVPSAGLSFNLKLQCNVQGSNLVARTTVRDPDAPIFDPEVLALQADPGGTVTVDLLNDIISEGRTPLLPETLEIVESPSAGSASITDGVFSFTAPTEPGTYSTTVQICGAPKPDSGIPGTSEEQSIYLGDNWTGSGGGGLDPRPVAFSLRAGEQETPLIWTVPGGSQPFLLPAPTPENWAPADEAGIVPLYALLSSYEQPTVAQIQGALEAVPAIGAGNVEVGDLRDEDERLIGFKVRYVNQRAEQDMPNLELGQWYAVPPQEALDRILEVATGLLAGDGDGEGEPPASGPFAGRDPLDPDDQAFADEWISQRLLDGDAWAAYLDFRVVQALQQTLVQLAPELLAFITNLFPSKVEVETDVEGEEPTPPQPLCAQGIIDVTVVEVEDATTDPGGGDGGAQVAGTGALPGAGASFVG